MAAKVKAKSSGPVRIFKLKTKTKRKGIHAKTKMSKNKGSKNYKKISIGQG
jgi:hypothetical protein